MSTTPAAPDRDERWYRAVISKDRRFDGAVYLGVTSTGIYCRPSCPARTPRAEHCRFFPTAAGAQRAGFRACKRCRPDAAPGSPEWNSRADTVGRAMRLIADGVVDREGVRGLATRLSYGERQLHRLLTTEVGAGPLALAVAQRTQTARLLIETTTMTFTDVAFAAGFSSVRQFNDTIAAVFAATPTELRRRGAPIASSAAHGAHNSHDGSDAITVRLAVRQPFHAQSLFAFLSARIVAGVENFADGTYRRVLRLPHGPGIVALTPIGDPVDHVRATLNLTAVSDLAIAVQRCRNLLDLDADPTSVADALARESLMATLVRCRPGLRVPGHVDGFELAVRAVLGQQVSVASARTLASRLATHLGDRLPPRLSSIEHGLTHVFPSAETVATMDPATLSGPHRRRLALTALAECVASGAVCLDPGADRSQTQQTLTRLPGVGKWTAGYISMRALNDPDVFLPTDLGVRHALERLGRDARPAAARSIAESWRPWRSYALMHLWSSL